MVFTTYIFPPRSQSHVPSSDVRVPWKLDSELNSIGIDYGPPFQNFHLGLQFPKSKRKTNGERGIVEEGRGGDWMGQERNEKRKRKTVQPENGF